MAGTQGNEERAQYKLGTVAGWEAFEVVRWHGIEQLSAPFRFEILAHRALDRGAIDLDALIDSGASFAIATTSGGWRVVHGLLDEATELDRTSSAAVYRFVLVPHFWRARFRQRCRNFVDKTLQEIVTAVLEN